MSDHTPVIATRRRVVCSCGRAFKWEFIIGYGYVAAADNFAHHLSAVAR